MADLWTQDRERGFFQDALENHASMEELFYVSDSGRYYAYWPRSYKGRTSNLSLLVRNTLISRYTEEFVAQLLKEYAEPRGLYAERAVVCSEIGLNGRSPAGAAICRKPGRHQKPEDIAVVFELRMSVVWNWEYRLGTLTCVGDFRAHRGTPSLMRSEAVLKAIGKGLSVRVSGQDAARIPIVVLGNAPLARSYHGQADYLRQAGIIQGFWCLNPRPVNHEGSRDNLKATEGLGYVRFDTDQELYETLDSMIGADLQFFSGMRSRQELGEMIRKANRHKEPEERADHFLALLRS